MLVGSKKRVVLNKTPSTQLTWPVATKLEPYSLLPNRSQTSTTCHRHTSTASSRQTSSWNNDPFRILHGLWVLWGTCDASRLCWCGRLSGLVPVSSLSILWGPFLVKPISLNFLQTDTLPPAPRLPLRCLCRLWKLHCDCSIISACCSPLSLNFSCYVWLVAMLAHLHNAGHKTDDTRTNDTRKVSTSRPMEYMSGTSIPYISHSGGGRCPSPWLSISGCKKMM